MTTPVLVVHGVNNHQEPPFLAQVKALSESLTRQVGDRFHLIPVFWGHLGAKEKLVGYTVPRVVPVGTRADDGELNEDLILEALGGTDAAGPVSTRSEDRADLVVASTLAHLDRSGGTRSDDEVGAVREAIEAEWSDTRWLQHTGDPVLLDEVGKSLADGLRAYEGQGDGDTTRSFDGLKAFMRGTIQAVDRSVGASSGVVLGAVNQGLRSVAGPSIVAFIGDVFVYQRVAQKIQDRLWEEIGKHAPGYGKEGKPIHVVAHSLGGVVTFDAAINQVADRRLWIDGYVTFGSQASLFHVMDPRGLAEFTPPGKIKLPPSIKTWTNLWEPMDLLAFLAASVFELDSGLSPRDVQVPHFQSSGIWTHSSYWTLPHLVDEIKATLAP